MAAGSGPVAGEAGRFSAGFGFAGPFWFLLALLAAALVFAEGLLSLGEAWATPEYSHGPIIPLLSFWLFLREMRFVPPTAAPITDRRPGLLALLFALLVGVLGNLVRIPDIVTYGFILWIGGMILIAFGARRGIFFWPSVLHLVFMLPLPNFLYWQLSIKLQLISSEIGVAVIALLGIPVYLDGNVIDLGSYQLQVAEACSGLRYLFPIMSFSYITALLYRGPFWHRALIFLAAAPITVAMNAFRIGVIGILVESYGIGQAEGFLHVFEGWVIFLACVGLLLLLATILQRLSPEPRPLHEALDLDFSGLHHQIARFGRIAPSAALIAAALAASGVALALHLAPARGEAQVRREPLVLFPRQVAGWAGQSQLLAPEIEAVLQAEDYHAAQYADAAEAAPVDLFVAWYRSQTDGSGIHSPQICLPAGGWEVSGWRQALVRPPGRAPFAVNRAEIRKGLERQLVYYWFEGRGRRLTGEYAAKFWALWDSVAAERSDGALVRLVTPIGPGESEAEAAARLDRFLGGIFDTLPRFVPG